MTKKTTDKFSAAEHGLGYIYQGRLALLHLLQLPEDTALFIEKDDDLDFIGSDGGKSLASLKHKAPGDRLTDLSTDFWKSVNIWLARYKRDGLTASNIKFSLFTTATVAPNSFLIHFLAGGPESRNTDEASLLALAEQVLARSKAKLTGEIAAELTRMSEREKQDFFSRITIFDANVRIDDIPNLIKDRHMRSVRREYREHVFERLEGWWGDAVIKQLTGNNTDGLYGFEVSDKLSAFADEYKEGNLPITFRGKEPSKEIDSDGDNRVFVLQLRAIGISANRIRSAILDYYRAFEQRSAWARENLLISGEIEDYEDRLTDEWSRYREVAFENLGEDAADDALMTAGKELYNWAEFETGKIESLRIRARVTEPYVVRGSFHMLAGASPQPKIYWHPQFLLRLSSLLGANQ